MMGMGICTKNLLVSGEDVLENVLEQYTRYKNLTLVALRFLATAAS